MKVLVVDDSATMRRIVVNSLRDIGLTNCVEAGDGTEALASYDRSVSLVITDWRMPGMGGSDFARALRAREDGRTVPVLMLASRSVRDHAAAALESGVSAYLVKPVTPQVLKATIDRLLAVPTARAS